MRLKRLRISGFRSIGVNAVIEQTQEDGRTAANDKPARRNRSAYHIHWTEAAFEALFPVDANSRHNNAGSQTTTRQPAPMMTAIMGPNSAGKSTILLALNLFFSNLNKLEDNAFHQHAPDAPIIIEATLVGKIAADSAWIERFCRGNGANTEITVASVWDKEGRSRFLLANNGLFYKQTAADRSLCARALPAFRMIWADTRPGEAAELKRDSLLSDLVAGAFQQRNDASVARRLDELLGALQNLLSRGSAPSSASESAPENEPENEPENTVDWSALDALEQQLSQGLAQLTPQQNRVRIRLDAALPGIEDVLARGVTVIDDGAALAFDSHGLGLQRAFAVSVLKAWCAQRIQDDRDYIFAVEEPEIYLHPHATRVMLRTLAQIAAQHQVLFTTHAGEFINRAPLQNVLMVSRRKQDKAWVSRVQRPHFRGLKTEELAKVQRYLCEDRSDMLFARAVLLVEGQAELFALPSFAATLGLDLDGAGVSVVFVNGIGNFAAYHQILRAFGIPHTILVDGDGKRGERLRTYTGIADAVAVLEHDFERALVDALTPERRRQLARACLQRRGKTGRDSVGSGARGAQDLVKLGKPLVGRVAGEFCTAEEIAQMPEIMDVLQKTVQLATGSPVADTRRNNGTHWTNHR